MFASRYGALDDGHAFNQTSFDYDVIELGHRFVNGKEHYPTQPAGDTVAIATGMLRR